MTLPSTPVSQQMRLALAEAERALGTTSPNPAVGAVVVFDGAVVGSGHTQPPGGPHAEVIEASPRRVLLVRLELS